MLSTTNFIQKVSAVVILSTLSSLVYASSSNCKPVYSDVFGSIYVKGSSFSIGTSSCNRKGILHSDVFGRVYCGDSPFSIGELKGTPSGSGMICRDVFGDFYIKGRPFKIDVSGVIDLKD